MSKKMRKKSSKSRTGEVARAKPPGPKKPVRKTSRTTSSAPGKSSKASTSAPRPVSSRGDGQKPLKTAPLRNLAEGARAPAFDLPRDGGTRLSLADFAGRKIAIFFYPRADTPGCTREAVDFSRLANAFAACGTAVLGVSADPVRVQESFRTKHKLSVPLMSDETHAMLETYGAWGEKSMYGRTFLGILRTTVLVDRDGRIAKVWRKVKVDGHADEVLAAAQSL